MVSCIRGPERWCWLVVLGRFTNLSVQLQVDTHLTFLVMGTWDVQPHGARHENGKESGICLWQSTQKGGWI